MNPAVICVAPNGARRSRADHPRLPIRDREIAAEAVACRAAGAHALHLHVRDTAGGHTLDAGAYRRATAAIRRAVGDELIVQVTTEAVGRFTSDEQMSLVRDLQPAAASIAVRELIPDGAAEGAAADFLRWAVPRVGLQFIVYDAADTRRLVDLAARGVIPPGTRPLHALFVLGRYTPGQQSRPDDLLPFLDAWRAQWPWTACAFGADEAACLARALALGGHVRVGFENNLLRPDGTPAGDNAEQVARVHGLLAAAGRRAATIHEARQVYGVYSAPC